MGDNDNGIVKVDQEFFKPCDGIQIQMVGRLVQEQNVRIAKQGFGKKNLDLLTAVQLAHISVVEICFDTETV